MDHKFLWWMMDHSNKKWTKILKDWIMWSFNSFWGSPDIGGEIQKLMVVTTCSVWGIWPLISNTALNCSGLLYGWCHDWHLTQCIFPNSLSLDLMQSFLYHGVWLHLKSPSTWTKSFVYGIHNYQHIISKTNTTNYLITMCNNNNIHHTIQAFNGLVGLN
jgi:hypothetical protein